MAVREAGTSSRPARRRTWRRPRRATPASSSRSSWTLRSCLPAVFGWTFAAAALARRTRVSQATADAISWRERFTGRTTRRYRTMTDPYEPRRPRDDALLEELNALREQEREGHATPKEQRRAEQLERRLRADEHGAGEADREDTDQPAEEFRRDRSQHGGMAEHLDDD